MSLSGGQKQRQAVATALLSEKPILIFDEPTSGLDYARMVEVSGVIRSLAQQGRIVLVVTHEHELVHRFHRRVVTLKGGQIVSDIPADGRADLDLPLTGLDTTGEITLKPAAEGEEALV